MNSKDKIKAAHAAWYRANVEALRATRYAALYGITVEDYDRMLAEQGGGCGMCGKVPTGRRLAVDHEHGAKGRGVRGILCSFCNRHVLANHSLERLEQAVAYLKRFEERQNV